MTIKTRGNIAYWCCWLAGFLLCAASEYSGLLKWSLFGVGVVMLFVGAWHLTELERLAAAPPKHLTMNIHANSVNYIDSPRP